MRAKLTWLQINCSTLHSITKLINTYTIPVTI